MPRLYSIVNDFDSNLPKYPPTHFFPSAEFGRHGFGSNSSWKFDLAADFPHYCNIHSGTALAEDEMTKNLFWIELRKTVERDYKGDCFYVYYKKDYKYHWNPDITSEYQKQFLTRKHGYWVFHFEDPQDQLLFIMQYRESLSPKRFRFHPDYGISCTDKRFDVDYGERVDGAYRV